MYCWKEMQHGAAQPIRNHVQNTGSRTKEYNKSGQENLERIKRSYSLMKNKPLVLRKPVKNIKRTAVYTYLLILTLNTNGLNSLMDKENLCRMSYR